MYTSHSPSCWSSCEDSSDDNLRSLLETLSSSKTDKSSVNVDMTEDWWVMNASSRSDLWDSIENCLPVKAQKDDTAYQALQNKTSTQKN